ncbi:hypothetical protein HYH03_000111 [Edaphochlamys debaryana]|uniref:Dienelactone hydrolase domain-containing protein n=1 Tax=Edaphochlamys debaryana TaxID=47281 RepID=A0A835YIL4_9CHLO|nr:hypothetical protein HYH03_000111 [Edaphochlamys debaryana]|eukprot:KAG2501606.1 hypothetical protein HYH03_000111 [Edaphochlamys debaryana]
MASEACCSAGSPVKHEYTPLGQFSTLKVASHADLPIYRSGSGKLGIVLVTDIFGFGSKQVFQVSDRIASEGFSVIAIDTFRGKPWTFDKFPPKPEHNFMDWITKEGSWAKLQPDVMAAAEKLKSEGISKLGCVGFCWSTTIALTAGQHPEVFSAVGGAHPALFGKEKELAEKVQVPVILLPAQGDASTDPIKAVLDKRPYGKLCVYQRFDDQIHGFVAARGDWTKPEVAAAAGQAIKLFTDFFKKTVGEGHKGEL